MGFGQAYQLYHVPTYRAFPGSSKFGNRDTTNGGVTWSWTVRFLVRRWKPTRICGRSNCSGNQWCSGNNCSTLIRSMLCVFITAGFSILIPL